MPTPLYQLTHSVILVAALPPWVLRGEIEIFVAPWSIASTAVALKIIAAIEDPPVIDKILSRPARRHAPQLVELIYSRQSDSRKPLKRRNRYD